MTIGIGIIWGVVWGFSSYKLAMSKGRPSFARFAAILGFLLGLIGFAIVACVRSTPEAKRRRADAKAAKLQVPPDLHEEHNMPIKQSADEHD
jgi:membrane associated rhomboid family serine protease